MTLAYADQLLEHAAFVRAVARAALGSDDLVEDVVQETWRVALQDGASRRGPLRAWLAGVARNVAANTIRRRVATRRRERRASRAEAVAGAADVVARSEVGRNLVGAVLSLPEPYRRCLLLRYHDDLPPRHIAAALGVPVETVRTRVKRGLAMLRERLEETYGHDDPGRDWRALLLPLAMGGARGAVLAKGGGVAGVAAALVVLALGGVGALVWHGRASEEPTSAARVVSPGTPADAGPALRGRPSVASPRDASFGDAQPRRTVRRLYEGRVVDRAGRGIEGAVLHPDPEPPPGSAPDLGARPPATAPLATTGPDGTFRIERDGEARLLWVRVRASGWAPVSPRGIALGSGLPTTVALQPARALRARVVDRVTGAPLAGARVRAYADGGGAGEGLRRAWAVALGTTDALGEVLLEVPPGRWLLAADAPGFAPSALAGSTEEARAPPVLALDAGRTFSARVVAADGRALANVGVEVFLAFGREAVLVTDADGCFVVGSLPLDGDPAAIDPLVRTTPSGALPVTVRAPRREEAGRTTLTLPAVTRLEGHAPGAGGAAVELTLLDAALEAGVARVPTARVGVDADGTFAFHGVPPGRAEVVLRAEGRAPLRRLVTIEPDVVPAPLVFEEGVPSGEVLVRVLDAWGAPVSGAVVRLLPVDLETPHRRQDWPPPARTDAAGGASLPPPDPSRVLLVIDAPGHAPAVQALAADDLARGEVLVRLGAGRAAGRVVHPDGRPARVKLRLSVYLPFAATRYGMPSETTLFETDAAGRFEAEGLAEGVSYAVYVDTPATVLLDHTVRVETGTFDARVPVATAQEAARLHLEAELRLADGTVPLRAPPIAYAPADAPDRHERAGIRGTLRAVEGVPGRYRSPLAVPPGRYRLEVVSADGSPRAVVVDLGPDGLRARPTLVLDGE